jgi:hypothetical protein
MIRAGVPAVCFSLLAGAAMAQDPSITTGLADTVETSIYE